MARVEASLKRAIEQAQKQRSTSDGHRTWQTLLTAATFMVEDEEGSQLSAQRTAAAIDVRKQRFNFAVGRADKWNPDLHSTEALRTVSTGSTREPEERRSQRRTGVANALRRRERFGYRTVGADGVATFLQGHFRERAVGEEGMRKYFATWSPYRMRKVHVDLIGKTEIYRPNSTLTGIEGTHKMYHSLRGGQHSQERRADHDGRPRRHLAGAQEGGRGSFDGRRREESGGAW
ncbi:unnamed protein product [Ectocarpus sp. 4 AP-2014]